MNNKEAMNNLSLEQQLLVNEILNRSDLEHQALVEASKESLENKDINIDNRKKEILDKKMQNLNTINKAKIYYEPKEEKTTNSLIKTQSNINSDAYSRIEKAEREAFRKRKQEERAKKEYLLQQLLILEKKENEKKNNHKKYFSYMRKMVSDIRKSPFFLTIQQYKFNSPIKFPVFKTNTIYSNNKNKINGFKIFKGIQSYERNISNYINYNAYSSYNNNVFLKSKNSKTKEIHTQKRKRFIDSIKTSINYNEVYQKYQSSQRNYSADQSIDSINSIRFGH